MILGERGPFWAISTRELVFVVLAFFNFYCVNYFNDVRALMTSRPPMKEQCRSHSQKLYSDIPVYRTHGIFFLLPDWKNRSKRIERIRLQLNCCRFSDSPRVNIVQ
jgi:hypothetical protein